MKRSIFVISILFFSYPVNAQVFWSENFDGTSCAAGSGCDPTLVAWSITNTGTNGATANTWYVSGQECGNAAGSCGSTCSGDQSLHIGNVAGSSAAAFWCPNGDCGASYDASSSAEQTDKRAESPVIDCSGQSNITVNFNYIENGQGTQDNAEFWYFDGSIWTMLLDLPKTSTCFSGQGQWTAIATINLPASANNNPNVKIGFRWVNNGDGVGTDPSFAVDDITLTNNTVLPVQWLEFKALYIPHSVRLYFSTLTEINNNYFEILKSDNGKNFYSIGRISGNGNSNALQEYSFSDDDVEQQTVYYYKIKQVDFNGKYSFSEVVAVNITPTEYIYINNCPMKVNNINDASIRCYDICGKLLYQGKDKHIKIPINKGAIFVTIYHNSTGILENHKFFIN